jgi:putative ABC transport system permease protein
LTERYKDISLWEVSSVPAQTFDLVLTRLRTVPGVVSVAAVSSPPFGSGNLAMPFLIEGRPAPTSPSVRGEGRVETQQTANYIAVTPGFFSTMRIPIIRGRDFDEHDAAGRTNVAIVNRAFARRYFPDGDPIGTRISLDFVPNEPQREIVAVVGDTAAGPLQHQEEPAIYVHQFQQSSRFAGPWVYLRVGMTYVLRTAGEPTRIVESVKRAVAEVDPSTPVAAIQTMEQTLDAQIRHLRLYMFLLGVFGGVAALLAATGIYGVMAYSVAERTREIGIRMALGARAQDVLRMVLRQATWMIGIGLLVGLASALAIARLIRSVLVEVSATDPATFAAVTALLVSIAAVACLVPTRRATSVDPTVALKFEQ